MANQHSKGRIGSNNPRATGMPKRRMRSKIARLRVDECEAISGAEWKRKLHDSS